MGRNYYKQAMALSNARKEEVYKYEKCEGLERRSWCQLHQDFNSSAFCTRERPPLFLASMWIGSTLRESMLLQSSN
jgi:hypothetical protein